jgi:hypothetical protein
MAYPVIDGGVAPANDTNYAVLYPFTAGENISSGNVVYIKKSDGKAYVSDTGTADDIRASGIALATVLSGASVNVLLRGPYVTSGLTANQSYYLGASGALSATASGVLVGYAISTTVLLINILQDDRDAVGTIKAYHKSMTGIPSNNMTAFWKECVGGTLSDAESPLNGQTLPDLNTTQRFLRGAGTSGTTGGSDSHSHSMNNITAVNSSGTAWGFNSGSPTTQNASSLPAYMQVVWIIKVK